MAKQWYVRRAPIQSAYLPFRPFERGATVFVGLLAVAFKSGYRYILTYDHICTRSVEAVPL